MGINSDRKGLRASRFKYITVFHYYNTFNYTTKQPPLVRHSIISLVSLRVSLPFWLKSKSRQRPFIKRHFAIRVFKPGCLYVEPVLVKLRGSFCWHLPGYTILRELLHRRFQLSLVQRKVIHAANTQDTQARESAADTVHERAAG
jgi:hypothetical protein